jgi:hypothetical protein
MLEVVLKNKNIPESYIDASHYINIIDVLCRLNLINGEIMHEECTLFSGRLKMWFYNE